MRALASSTGKAVVNEFSIPGWAELRDDQVMHDTVSELGCEDFTWAWVGDDKAFCGRWPVVARVDFLKEL